MAYPYTSYQNPYQQGYYPMYQPMQQPIQQPMQQPQQQQSYPINQNGIIWISGAQEAAMFPIAPNNAVALWEKSGKTIYLKSADATGKPTMRVYDLVERVESDSDGVSAAEDKHTAYATKDDLAAVVGVVRDFDGIISSMRTDIEKMSGDLYGIAGKKKAKKAEVAEDE